MSSWYDASDDQTDEDGTDDDDDLFDWDDGNLDHIARHNVTREEAEEALLDRRRVGVHVHQDSGEQRCGAIGATGDGRILAVVFTKRAAKLRVVTARTADQTERRRYRR